MNLERNVNSPARGEKFIQIYVWVDGVKKPYMRFGRGLHLTILQEFLSASKIKYDLKKQEEKFLICEKKEGVYELVGAGKQKLLENKKIGLYEKSHDYNIFPNKEHLNEIKKYFPYELVLMDFAGENVLE